MLSRETSDWSLKRRSDGLGEEEFEDFEEDKDLDEDFDDELDEDELEEEDLDDLDEYDDLDDEFDDEDEEDFRPRKARRGWEGRGVRDGQKARCEKGVARVLPRGVVASCNGGRWGRVAGPVAQVVKAHA